MKVMKVKKLIRRLGCYFNYHYHPEEDGMYMEDLSYGRCHSCGEIIKKTKNGWKLGKLK